MTATVTRDLADAVLAAVVARYATTINGMTFPADEIGPELFIPGLDEADHPKLVENYRGGGHFAVVWESGPFEWAMRVCDGDIDEEIASVLHHEFGVDKQEAGRRARQAVIELPARVAARVHVEPYTSYALGIYPA